MRVFLTGATGFVGSAIVRELLASGHQVLGLTRSDAGAEKLASVGAEIHRGSLEDLESLRDGARKADAVIHTAFNHDFSRFAAELRGRPARDRGDGRGPRRLRPPPARDLGPWRCWRRAASRPKPTRPSTGFSTRLGDGGRCCRLTRRARLRGASGAVDPRHRRSWFRPASDRLAREKGVAAYVGDGLNRWPGVHRLDAARLYRLALEQGVESGPYHAVADEGVPFKAIAEVIGRRLGVPVVSMSPKRRPGISAGSPGSPAWTFRPRARGPDRRWDGSRSSRGSSPISISPIISSA